MKYIILCVGLVLLSGCSSGSRPKAQYQSHPYTAEVSKAIASGEVQKESHSTNTVAQAKSFIFSNNINSEVDRLPKDYRGDSFDTVFSKLAKPTSKKMEFETTSEYEQRLGKVSAGIYAFRQSLSKGDKDLIFKYDADNETLLVMPRTSSLSMYQLNKPSVEFALYESTSSVGSRIGQNAFGARVSVKEYVKECSALKVVNSEKLIAVTNPKGKDPNFSVNISLDYAKKYKNSLEIIVIGIVTSDVPQAFVESRYIEPTLKSPTGLLIRSKCINFKVVEIWVYNGLTGEVVCKKIVEQI